MCFVYIQLLLRRKFHRSLICGWSNCVITVFLDFLQVTALSKDVAALEAQVERITREKNSLVSQLEESQCQLASHEMEMNKVSTFIKEYWVWFSLLLWPERREFLPLSIFLCFGKKCVVTVDFISISQRHYSYPSCRRKKITFSISRSPWHAEANFSTLQSLRVTI